MKIINKIIIMMIFVATILLVGMYNISYAEDTTPDLKIYTQDVNNTFNMFEQNNIGIGDIVSFWNSSNTAYYTAGTGVYCVEHLQNLSDSVVASYNVINKVSISDDISTDTATNTKEKAYNNAVLAYIISGSDGTNSSDKTRGPVQLAIWNFMSQWINGSSGVGAVGQKHGIPNTFAKQNVVGSTAEKAEAQKLLNEAKAYAESISAGAEESTRVCLEDKTEKPLQPVQKGNDVELGPFKYVFTGEITEISVVGQNSTQIDQSNVTLKNASGSTISSITSNEEFYIQISDMDKSDLYGFSVKVKATIMTKTADIWFLQARASSYQNLIVVKPGEEPKECEMEFTYETEELRFAIKKVVEGTKDAPIQGAIFEIEFTDENGKEYYVNVHNGNLIFLPKFVWTYHYDNDDEVELRKIDSKNLREGDVVLEDEPPKFNIETVWNEDDIDDLPREVYQLGSYSGDRYVFNIVRSRDLEEGDKYLYFTGEYRGYELIIDRKAVTDEEIGSSEHMTDINGEIALEGIQKGSYTATEIYVPEGYEIIQEVTNFEIKDSQDYQVVYIENRIKGIIIEGLVWNDGQEGKESTRNDLYDSNEEGVEGVKVELVPKGGGEAIAQTVTDANGKYILGKLDSSGDIGFNGATFDKIDIDEEEIVNYEIRFSYDGFVFQSVEPNLGATNGSKADEDNDKYTLNDYMSRPQYNERFTYITGNGNDTGSALNSSGNEEFELEYEEKDHTSTLNHPENKYQINGDEINIDGNEDYMIIASTENAGYDLGEGWNAIELNEEYNILSIKNINLGLYEREHSDIAIVNDLNNARVLINGQQHIYVYDERKSFGNQAFEITFRNADYYNASYTREVYESDYSNTSISNQLEIYLTYSMTFKNQSSTLKTEVVDFINYYDSRYTVTGIGDSVQSDEVPILNDKWDIQYNSSGGILEIKDLDKEIYLEAGETKIIYIEYMLDRQTIADIVTSGTETDNNVTEIVKYSTYDDEGIYASVDTDSNPSNADKDDTNTYEDDTDRAPGLKLSEAEAREIAGIVFEDDLGLSDTIQPGEHREGNGMLDKEQEFGISGVEVVFTEKTTNISHTVTTDENGNYSITGYIPGYYTMTYTWGDQTYHVNNYKGTIYKENARQNSNKWHVSEPENINTDTRYSDAMDNWDRRIKIDNSLTSLNYDTNTTMKYESNSNADFWNEKMTSATPEMSIGVENKEYDNTVAITTGGESIDYIYKVYNVDFGIVQRPMQDVIMEKRVSSLKLILATGQTYIDIVIAEDGSYTGTEFATKVLPNKINIEMDNEILQGSTLEVNYTYKVTNNSELDYVDENYYKYGQNSGYDTNTIVTHKYSEIIDYLDKDWATNLDQGQDTKWKREEIDYLNNKVHNNVLGLNKDIVTEVDSNLILSRLESENGEEVFEPTETLTYNLLVSKILTSSVDIELSNETEIIKLDKTGGSEIQTTLGNYVPGGSNSETDDDIAEHISILPPTGANLDYTTPIIVVVTSLGILIIGIFVIRKVVLKGGKK